MAAYWDPMWDDEQWLENQSAATLRYIYTVAVSRGDKDDKKTMVAARLSQKLEETNKQEKGFKNENVSEADLLAYTQHMEDTENAGNTGNYDEYRQNIGETVDERLLEYTDTPWKNKDGSTPDKSLAYYANQWKFAILAKASDLLGRIQPAKVQTRITSIIGDLEANIKEYADKSFSRISDHWVDTFIAADQLGVFDNVDRGVVNDFYASMANAAGLRADKTPANDSALKSLVGSTAVRDEDGALTDLYSECSPLATVIQYEFPDGTSDEDKAKFTNMYNDQLMANAAQRAAQAILQDRGFLAKNKTEEEIKDAYKQKVAEQFERSVVLAGLAGNEATAVMMNEIVIDKDGHAEYKGDAEGVDDAIEGIINGMVTINGMAVQLDKYMLDQETDALAKEMKMKKIEPEGLTFWQGTKKVASAVYDNIVKQGGWKKIGLSVLAFAGAGMAWGTGVAEIAAAGAALYAGWTAVNAWVMPAHDLAKREGLSFKEAFARKKAEPDFKKRAWFRTVEGIVGGSVGAVAGVSGLSRWVRTITMTSGKGLSLISSFFKKKSAQKNLQRAQEILKEEYSLASFKQVKDREGALQTAQAYVKQDGIALASVVVGALVGEGIRDYMQHDGQGSIGESGSAPESNTQLEDVQGSDPAQGNEGAAQGDEGAAQGDEGAAQGDEGAAQGDEGAAQGDEGVAQGDEGAVQGDEGASQADEGAENGNESGTEHKGLNQREDGRYYGDHKLDDNGPYDIKQVDFDKYEHLQPYDKSMGTSGQAYRTLFRVYGAKELDRMYAALDRDGVMDHFKGMTPTQVLARFRGLDHWTERFGKDGFSIQGATRYHHEEAMTALNKLFGPCGDQLTDQEYASINKSFEDVDNYGGYHGAGKIAGNNNYVYRSHGYNTPNCPDGQLNEMRSGGQVVHAPTPAPEPTPEPEPELAPEPEPAPKPEPIEQEDRTVNAVDAQYKFRTTYDNNQDESVDPASVNGKDHNGWVYDDDTVDVTKDGETIVQGSKTREVYPANPPMVDGIPSTAYPMNLTALVEKFPDEPTAITENKDGSVLYEYEAENGGKTWSVLVDAPKNGASTMHLFQGDREVIMDNQTGDAVAAKISESGPLKCTHQHDAGNSVEKIKFSEKVAAQRAGASAGTAAGFTPRGGNSGR